MTLTIITSWDDGHILDKKLAQLLLKYKIAGTFYIAPQNREWPQNQLLTAVEIKELAKQFEIGAHTMTHPVLTRIPLESAQEEITQSRKYLEKLTGKSVLSFCYPRGRYNKALANAVKKAGFTSARTIERYSFSDPTDAYMMHTSLHCYSHYSDLLKMAKLVGVHRVPKHFSWDVLGKFMLEHARTHGGVYPNWGHSWEIEKNNDWDRLEQFLQWVSTQQDVRFLTVGKYVSERVL